MHINTLKKRLRQDRPASVVQVRMPDDVIEDLKRIAPKLGIPDYQALICHYVGKGLREDVERHGVSETTIHEAVEDIASENQSPCLDLPAEAWDEPRLLSACPLCRQPLKFNPFVD